MPDRDVFIISAVRTAMSLEKPGRLHGFEAAELAGAVLREAARRADVAPGRVEDVLLGSAVPSWKQSGNLARDSARRAGFPGAVPGVEIKRGYGSGQQALHFAAQAILAGDAEILMAGGVDAPSHLEPDFSAEMILNGDEAEALAAKWSLGRAELDDYAAQSRARAAVAQRGGFFDGQILSLGEYGADGLSTDGNSAQAADGAAALLLASEKAVGKYNLSPLVRIEARVVAGADGGSGLESLVVASRLALKRSGLTIPYMSIFEIDESHAALPLAWARALEADLTRINPNGGMLAHGHALGAAGAVLLTKLVHELDRRRVRYGLQCVWNGDGTATATILERV